MAGDNGDGSTTGTLGWAPGSERDDRVADAGRIVTVAADARAVSGAHSTFGKRKTSRAHRLMNRTERVRRVPPRSHARQGASVHRGHRRRAWVETAVGAGTARRWSYEWLMRAPRRSRPARVQDSSPERLVWENVEQRPHEPGLCGSERNTVDEESHRGDEPVFRQRVTLVGDATGCIRRREALLKSTSIDARLISDGGQVCRYRAGQSREKRGVKTERAPLTIRAPERDRSEVGVRPGPDVGESPRDPSI